jgi:predicted TIM-barrel fold metal-dependent hydrolase
MIDAYLHVGGLRFGPADLAVRELARYGIARGIMVLPPVCPDFDALRRARELMGDAVRLVGIPFGDTDARRAELTAWQIAFGITGMRMMPHEITENQSSLDLMGAAGAWLFAINPCDSAEITSCLLDWLEKHPSARIASPHFLKPGRLDRMVADPSSARQLLAHPRFFAILSRQGATGSTQPYPHPDLRGWVEDVVAIMGWEKILWGSEYPVIHWRDETMPCAVRWIRDFLPKTDEGDLTKFIGQNAERLFFTDPAPNDSAGPAPSWLPSPPHAGLAVPMAQKGIKLPPEACEKITRLYLEAHTPESPIVFSEFLARWIERHL